jgi:hypothetical protein
METNKKGGEDFPICISRKESETKRKRNIGLCGKK